MLKNKGGRPRVSDEGVDEATLKKRQKAREYAAKKRAELQVLKEKSMVFDKKIEKCDEHMKGLKEDKKELQKVITDIKKDLKVYQKKPMTPFIYEELDLPIPKPIKKSKPKPAMSAMNEIEPSPMPKKLKQLKPLPPKMPK